MTPRAGLPTPAASSDLMASLAQHAGALATNRRRNVRMCLVVYGVHPENSTKAGERGVEARSLRKAERSTRTRYESAAWPAGSAPGPGWFAPP